MSYHFRYRKYAEALYEALTEDAFYIAMEKSVVDGSPREAMIRYMDYSMIEAERYGELVISERHDFGASLWSRPLEPLIETEKGSRKKEFIKNHMGRHSLETYNIIVEFMSKESAGQIDKQSWYLSIVGILPQYQGHGFGVELVTKILHKTDRLKIPTYLETFTPQNFSFYKRFGYRPVKQIHEPTSNGDYCLMVRNCPS